ncbi:MAG: Zn-dependent hydrolase [Gemmatimonadetes bacterium]|nr:Zn-dependent hydrolase [Gemmatimonadota bacterium]
MRARQHLPVALSAMLVLPTFASAQEGEVHGPSTMQALVDQYALFRLEADLSHLSENDRQVVRLLIEAAEPMDGVFWQQAYGDKETALALAGEDAAARRYIEINYGPWDRLRGDGPFIDGVGDKPAGANFYPADMTAEEFEAAAADNEALRSLYTLVRRDEGGRLVALHYHKAFAEAHMAAAAKLREAAGLASDPGLAPYLMLRADALETDDYQPSDMAWLDMKDNPIDVIIGPIETYEDQMFGAKAAHEGFVLIKDMEWSERLARFAALLPSLQESLPVPGEYKAEMPGTDSDLNAYDAVYYAGDANAGAKTIAINLPNDEEVQLAKGTRRLQLKNAMQAKFDKIMVGIADELIDEDQQHYVVFDAFFGNVMFHEVAHGLGIKNTIDGTGTVREALREHASPMEEGKADVVGLHMVTQLFERGELTEHSVEHHYVTFLAGIFRSVRFGAASAHGRANMVRFNYFREHGAFSRDEATGRYRVDFEAMRAAVAGLSELILTLQGDGDYEGVAALIEEKGVVPPELQADLDRLDAAGIPRDIVFEQGVSVLFGES